MKSAGSLDEFGPTDVVVQGLKKVRVQCRTFLDTWEILSLMYQLNVIKLRFFLARITGQWRPPPKGDGGYGHVTHFKF